MEEFIIALQAKLDEEKSRGNINSDIADIQSNIDKLKLQAEIDPKAVVGIIKQLEGILNQKLAISNIEIDQEQAVKESRQTGKQMGGSLNKGLQDGLKNVKQSIKDVMKDFDGKKLSSADLSKMFNLNRPDIDSAVTKQVRALTKEINSLAAEILRTDSEGAWERIIGKADSLSKVLKQFGRIRDISSFEESLDIAGWMRGKKVFVSSKAEALQNTGMNVKELNNQFRSLGVTFTTLAKNSMKLDTVWEELFDISPGLEKYETFGGQLSAIVEHLKIAKSARYGDAGLQPADGWEATRLLSDYLIDLEGATRKLTSLREMQDGIGQDMAKASASAAVAVTQSEGEKQQAYVQTAKVASTAMDEVVESTETAARRMSAMADTGLSLAGILKKGMSKVMQLFGIDIMSQFTSQLRNAWQEAERLDASMTSLGKVCDELADRDSFPAYLDKSIGKAKELYTDANDLLYAVTEFKKLGNTLENSEILAEYAIRLQNVGDTDIDTAISSIKTAMAAFDTIGGYTDQEYSKKVEAYIDLINNLSNKFSVDAEGLAKAVRISAGTLTEANTSIEEVASIISAANRYYDDPTYLAHTIKIGSLRLRASKTSEEAEELKELGEDIDDLAESTSQLREEMLALTGVDIMVDDKNFKSYYQQLLDISEVYQSLDETTQANVLEKMFGKNRSAAGANIVKAMSDVSEVYDEAMRSAGSSEEEFSRWTESAEAATKRFGIAMTETYNNILNGETVKGLTNAGTAVLDFSNKWGILEGTIKGFLALGVLKGITSLTVAFKNSAVQASNFGTALKVVKDVGNYTEKTQRYADAMRLLKDSCSNLTDVQLKQVLANRNLSESQLIEILQLDSLEAEQKKVRLSQLGLVQATKEQTMANGAAITSTFSFTAAMKGLGANLKATFLSNPVALTIMALTTIISLASTAVNKYKEKLEEANKATEEAIQAYKSLASEVESLEDKISDLNSQISKLDPITDEEDINNLKLETEELNTQLAILKEKQRIAGAEADKAAQESLGMTQASRYKVSERESAYGGTEAGAAYVTKDEELLNAIEAYDRYKAIVDEANKSLAEMAESGGYSRKEWNEQEKAVSMYSERMDDARSHANELAVALNEQKEGLDGNTESSKNLLDAVDGAISKYDEWLDRINGVTDSLNVQAGSTKEAVAEKVSFDIAAYKEQLDGIQSTISTLRSALDSLNTGSLDASAVIDLMQEFPELEPYIDMAADGFGNLAEGLHAAIMEKPSALIDDLESMKESLETEEERGQVELLIAALQRLGSISVGSFDGSIDNVQSSISTLRSALDSFNKGELDKIQVIDLMQQFPELTPYIDLAAEGFGNLSEGLSALIEQQPDSLIQSLQSLKGSLTTDAEREQVDMLIDSLQRLSSYGDSGIEAYATTIGSTWDDTANVIEGVTNQFESLAKVQEAVADGLTVTATAAAELAKMYPEILDHAQVTADGQITLNEEVVKNILDGDKSIIDAQIMKLEADKAELTAKKAYAEAQLEMAKQVGEGEGSITKEVAQYRLDIANQLLHLLIEAGMEEDRAYAAVAANMAGNMDEYNRIVAEVANDTSSNMDAAAVSFANSVNINAIHAQESLEAVQRKVWDLADAIKASANGQRAGNSGTYGGGGSSSSGGIKATTHTGDFNMANVDFSASDFSFGDFQSQLELDIKGYTDAISNIDAQIEVLKNLQATFDSHGGIGGHGYADKIKDLEKEKGKINDALKDKGGSGSGSGSAKEAKDEFEEMVDLFERRAKVLNDVLSLLKANMDNVSGSFAKNKLVDAELGVTEEKFNNYTDALAMYTQKANEALAVLPADIAKKVREGAVELTDFIGDGNKGVVEAIKAYESWSGKVSDCQQELAGLKKEIRQLELEKFNNIMDDFNDQFDLRSNSKDLISKQIDLLKEAGELIGESFFNAQIDQSQKQLGLLEAEKAQLVEQMASAVSSGRVQKGTEEWLEMANALSDVEGNILDCKKSIEEFDNSILEIHTEVFNRIQDRFSDLSSEISNIIDLFDGMEVSDDKGIWSKEGIAQLGLLAQQYELAQHQVQQYNDEIAELQAQYAAGKYSATEYMDKLSQLSKEQWDAVDATEAAKDAILKLNEARVENAVKGIEKEIDAYDELTQAQIDALRAEKDLHDYQKTISEKTKSVADLEKQIEAMRNDTSLASVAKRKKLEEQLVEAKKALEEEQYAHSMTVQEEALNKQFEEYKKSRDDEIESLRESLNDKETIIAGSFETVKDNADIIGQEIASIAVNHGITVSDALISSWKSGEMAIAGYGEALSQGTSAFIGNIMGVENELWNLQANANRTANTLAWMFSTKADGLVNELAKSYYAETNLANMTNALQDSLVNALERGYNVSGIVNALGSVESAARSAKAAVDALNSTPRGGGGSSHGSSGASSGGSGSGKGKDSSSSAKYYLRNGKGDTIEDLDYYPSSAELEKLKKKHGEDSVSVIRAGSGRGSRKVAGYANGVHDLDKDEIAWVSEKGKELIMSPSQQAILMALKKGDTVLTKEQTDNMYEWSKRSPQEMYSMEDTMRLWGHMIDPKPLTTEYKVNNNSVNIQSMLTVNGDVNDLKHLNEQMERIATKISNKSSAKAADNAIRKLAEGIRH